MIDVGHLAAFAIGGGLVGIAGAGWLVVSRNNLSPRNASQHTDQGGYPEGARRFGSDPSGAVVESLRRMLHTEVIEVRKVGHADLAERLRDGISDVVGAIDAHHGRGIRVETVDLSRTLADVGRGKQVVLPVGGIPRVWGDPVRLGISLSWMVSEALHWGDAASIEVDLSGDQLLLKVWPRQDPAQAASAMRHSAVPYLRGGANRYQAERAWAEAQGGRLQGIALEGGDPAFFLTLRAVEAFGSAPQEPAGH